MNPIYQKALDGTLFSAPQGGEIHNVTFTNDLPIPLYCFLVFQNGELISIPLIGGRPPDPPNVVLPNGGTFSLDVSFPGMYFAFVSAYSGGFVCVIEMLDGVSDYPINSGLLLTPNDMGSLPAPNSSVIIPGDSPLVVVGAGIAPNGNVVTREQYWHQGANSYTMAPGQTNSVSYTTTSGMQQTSSQQQTFAIALGLSGEAGWGPFSASLSSSLNSESTTFQQFTASQEMTQNQSTVLTNNTDEPQMFLVWQLMDVATVYGLSGSQQVPLASMVIAQTPTLIAGPYNPTKLPAPPERPVITDEMMANLPKPLRRPPTRNWRGSQR